MVAGLIGAAARTRMRNDWRPSQTKQENERRREEMSLRKQQRQPRPRSASPSASSRLHSPTCAVPLAQPHLRRGIPRLSIRLYRRDCRPPPAAAAYAVPSLPGRRALISPAVASQPHVTADDVEALLSRQPNAQAY